MARSLSPGIVPYLDRSHGVLPRNNSNVKKGKCVEDAIMNAISWLLEREVAQVARKELRSILGGEVSEIDRRKLPKREFAKRVGALRL